jgi:polysaccharide export outer membrane protein
MIANPPFLSFPERTLMTTARTRHPRAALASVVAGLALLVAPSFAAGQAARPANARPAVPQGATTAAEAPSPAVAGSDYKIAPNDVLVIGVWKEVDLTGEVVVRPDGKISLPLLNDLAVANLTPEQLRVKLVEQYHRFYENPVVTVVLKQVNNNKAFVMGQVLHPGAYVVSGDTTVLQVIALAGGFAEFADTRHVAVIRQNGSVQETYEFNYDDFVKRHTPKQNIVLKPGDTVIVP